MTVINSFNFMCENFCGLLPSPNTLYWLFTQYKQNGPKDTVHKISILQLLQVIQL